MLLWYKVSDKNGEVVFFVECSLEQAKTFLMKKEKDTTKKLILFPLKEKPESIVKYGCSRIDFPQKNMFINVFVQNQKKGKKDPP
ncbi:MAG: hypothetical protein PHV23_01750 [Candidatus Gracilibacteria bacterium]|nr:hypothetical protein [Candidatus Gracilibacteria bacterium]